jgi:hypothetical protein
MNTISKSIAGELFAAVCGMKETLDEMLVMMELSKAAARIGDVVELINPMAGQTWHHYYLYGLERVGRKNWRVIFVRLR